jgi:hypothetical protein
MANTNPSVVLTQLDFDSYKNSLKTFLNSQSQFADWNFDGSNLSVLMDLLSYNTYMNAFYTNMAASEMFLDTAQLRDSVVLRAKELNYCPRSFKSSQAVVNLAITSNATILTIPAGTTFTGKSGSNNYTFSTQENIVISSSNNGVFYANAVTLYEGTTVTDTFVVQPASNTDTQFFTLSNPTVDTSTLTVVSVENNGSTVIPYLQSTTLLDLNSNSAVYFLQGADNSLFQVIFGDNVVGRRPADNAVVITTYLATSGQLPNGISIFTPNGTIGGSSQIQVTTVSAAQGGDIAESISSIKYNAPRYYATQERCVTWADYQTLMTLTFPEIEAISVYGGETVTPPQYGQVFIALKLYNFDAIPQSKIIEYQQFLNTRAPLTITPQFINPDYTYASVTTTVDYNVNETPLQPADINAFVTSAIQNYNTENLDDFATTLYYSRLVEAIDGAHSSIIANETDYTIMKKLIPNTALNQNYSVNFNVPLYANYPPEPGVHPATQTHTLSSSQFVYNGQLVLLEDDGQGNVRIVQSQADGNHHTLLNIGTINYSTGVVNLISFQPQSYIGDSIRIYCVPANKNNSVTQNQIFEIPNDEINCIVNAVSQ